MVNRVGQLVVLLTGCLALAAACSGNTTGIETPTEPEPPAPAGTFPTLPPPSQIKFESEMVSDRLTPGSDFETGLPNEYVTAELDSAVFDSHWNYQKEPAFALYRLYAPGSSIGIRVRTTWTNYWGFGEVWMGIADFENDRWVWDRVYAFNLEEQQWIGSTWFYDRIFQKDNHVLAAIVCLDDKVLNSLVAGEVLPPIVLDVSPELFMTGSSATFSTEMLGENATDWSWDFGAGAVPQYSTEVHPVVVAQAPGEYTGEVIAENNTGSHVHGFSYTIAEENPYIPLHLYAVPEKTTVQVDEELVVTIVTGQLPNSKPLAFPIMGLLVESGAEFVQGSVNLGSPGGEKYGIDGVWAEMDPAPEDFFSFGEGLIEPRDTGVPGMVRFDFSTTPLGPGNMTSAGDIINLLLVFRETGTYHLSFQSYYGVPRTNYSSPYDYSLDWLDISNSGIPAITVLP